MADTSPVPVLVELRIDSTPPPPKPLGFDLTQNRPNPYVTYHDPETVIRYQLEEPDFVRIRIYNGIGQRVRTLVSESNVLPNDYIVRWDGRDDNGARVASGHYFYRMTTSRGTITKRMILIK